MLDELPPVSISKANAPKTNTVPKTDSIAKSKSISKTNSVSKSKSVSETNPASESDSGTVTDLGDSRGIRNGWGTMGSVDRCSRDCNRSCYSNGCYGLYGNGVNSGGFVDDSVESVDTVSSIFDDTFAAIGLNKTVRSLDNISMTDFALGLCVSSMGVIDTVVKGIVSGCGNFGEYSGSCVGYSNRSSDDSSMSTPNSTSTSDSHKGGKDDKLFNKINKNKQKILIFNSIVN